LAKDPDSGLLDYLRRFDTPTICNALEFALGGRRATGFTRRSMVCAFPELPPVVGYARTATLRASSPSAHSATTQREMRLAYYEYVRPRRAPTVVVLQDLDFEPGIGAFWGEINSKVHEALGCVGVLTNGALRDLGMISPTFQIIAGMVTPSHAHVRIESIETPVSIFGMDVTHDDLVHADRHGAVVIPREALRGLRHAIDVVVQREKLILDAVAAPGFGIDAIRAALAAGDDIH
jgi:regulator of RNase E activity RraA